MGILCPLDLTRAEMIAYSPDWMGDRAEDGRPLVSDSILERMKKVSITEAWAVLQNAGFRWQYAGGFQCTHPGKTLVGRAVTAMYMPRRPDMRQIMEEAGTRHGCIGDQISWPIDLLVKGDVYVADVFGKIMDGPVIGDNLATAIHAKTGLGVVHDAAVRDLDGISEIEGFTSFIRGFHPSYASPTIMLTGMNVPIRIGEAIVMPGDVVLGQGDGVVFIPAHLAEKVVRTSELVRLRDSFGKSRIRMGVYSSGEVDARWTSAMEHDFSEWLKDSPEANAIPEEDIRELLAERTW